MKRKATGLILLSALCLLTASCYKDLSTLADHEIPDIVVTGLAPEIHVTYGEELDITVQVSQEGRTASDFDLVWSIDLNPDRQADRIEEEANINAGIAAAKQINAFFRDGDTKFQVNK